MNIFIKRESPKMSFIDIEELLIGKTQQYTLKGEYTKVKGIYQAGILCQYPNIIE